MRIGVIKGWSSKWFSDGKEYIKNVEQDVKIRKHLIKNLREAGVDKVEIERSANKITINIHTAKPGLIIGRGGNGVEELKKKLHTMFLKNLRPAQINLNIIEVDRPNLSAQINIQSMSIDIEKRMPFRRVMKQTLGRIERAGALGGKVTIGGRLNGAEIARSETLTFGKIPLHTLRADIDYARGVASTTYGAIGLKCWVYKGDVFEKDSDAKRGEILGKKSGK